MFTLRWATQAEADFAQLRAEAEGRAGAKKKKGKASRQQGTFKQVCKALMLLQQNPRHPGLNTHAYDSLEHPFNPNEKVWEAYAQNYTPGAYRIFWCYGPGKQELTIIAITPHP